MAAGARVIGAAAEFELGRRRGGLLRIIASQRAIMDLPRLLEADTTFFTIIGYQMSYVEFFGTVLNLLSVWLVSRRSILTWPVGIVAVVLFGILFYQLELYSDVVEQIYFIVTGIYGWIAWMRLTGRTASSSTAIDIERLSRSAVAWCLGFVAVGGLAMGALMANIHQLLPRIFDQPAAYPYVDAITTVMSFAAQLLMAHRKVESWVLWIVVDVIGIWLYHARGVDFISLLYVVFLVLALKGFWDWSRQLHTSALGGGDVVAVVEVAT